MINLIEMQFYSLKKKNGYTNFIFQMTKMKGPRPNFVVVIFRF
jgi:hypothetical protein